jgi:hypothetical protein
MVNNYDINLRIALLDDVIQNSIVWLKSLDELITKAGFF